MPDFRHVGDFAALELHDVNVVSPRGLMCRRTGTTSQVRADKDAVCAHIVTLCVGRERLQLVPSVRQHGHQAFHPLGIVAERLREVRLVQKRLHPVYRTCCTLPNLYQLHKQRKTLSLSQ